MERLREQAKDFEDYETLARIGRLYKESGDRKWEAESTSDVSREIRPPSMQMFDMALDAYAEAFETTGDWYVGINAATLALLTGNSEQAIEYAAPMASTTKTDHRLC